jgi:NAD(P)-dependent dehydrogenase (short-subunit alcohol dehydrogenase family)
MGRLTGKVAFLTGGGAGIAKAVAGAFAREGAKVALLEIDRDAGGLAEEEIHRSGGDALFVQTDVTDDASVRRAVAEVITRFGKLDIIVNAAGGSVPEDKPVHEMDPEVWMRVIKLNLLHPFLCGRHGIPHMIRSGGGSIINFSSLKGMVGSDRPAYAAAKGGIVALTRTMAAQYAQYGIRVNAIAPGSVLTERTERQHATAAPEYLAVRNQRRKNYPFSSGTVDDMTGVAVFLASDESRMFTGTTLAADGGVSSYLNLAIS